MKTSTSTVSDLSFLTVNHPENRAKELGALSYYHGRGFFDNPFGPGRPTFNVRRRRAWNAGWYEARDLNRELSVMEN